MKTLAGVQSTKTRAGIGSSRNYGRRTCTARKMKKDDRVNGIALKHYGERVELRGWMYMPIKDSMSESALCSKYFNTLESMLIYLAVLKRIDKSALRINGAKIIDNALGISDLVRISDEYGVCIGYCFTAYYPSVFENAARIALYGKG